MSRYCPVCDGEQAELICPIHGVPTVAKDCFERQYVSIETGDWIDERYRVERILGSGSMGTVFDVVDRQNKRFALKVIKVREDSSRQITKRFYREALAANRIQHPNVVNIERFAVDERSGQPYQVMEFLDGVTLLDFMEQEQRTVNDCLDVLTQLLDTLAHAHRIGVIHRDLKPENLMLVDDDEVRVLKVLDFGIAKILEHDGDAPTLTATGVAVGTPHYMSPEQAKGFKVTPSADLYSVACLGYELLSGKPPFSGDDFMSILISHVRDPIPELPSQTPWGEDIPEHVRVVLAEALQKKPERRPASALHFQFALQQNDRPSLDGDWMMGNTDEMPTVATKVSQRKLAGTVILIAAALAAFLMI